MGGSLPPPFPLLDVEHANGKKVQRFTVLLVVVVGGSAPPPFPLANVKGENKNTAAEHKMQMIVWYRFFTVKSL